MSDRPPAVFVAGPRHWRDLGEALAKRGLEVYGLFSGRPSYNWFPRFIEAEQDHRQMREALLLAEPGLIDLQKSCIAVPDPEDGNLELQTRLVALKGDLAWAYAMRRAIGPLLTEKWCSAVVTTCTYDPLGRTVVAAARDAGVPVVHVAQALAPDEERLRREVGPPVRRLQGELAVKQAVKEVSLAVGEDGHDPGGYGLEAHGSTLRFTHHSHAARMSARSLREKPRNVRRGMVMRDIRAP